MQPIPKDVISEIIINSSPDTLFRLCTADKNFNRLCNDQSLWKLKLKHDYPNIDLQFPISIMFDTGSYKELYLLLFRNGTKQISIYYNGKYIMNLWTSNKDTYKTVLNKLTQSALTRDIIQKKSVTHDDWKTKTPEVVLTFKHNDKTLYKSNLYGLKDNTSQPGDFTSIWITDTEIFER